MKREKAAFPLFLKQNYFQSIVDRIEIAEYLGLVEKVFSQGAYIGYNHDLKKAVIPSCIQKQIEAATRNRRRRTF